MEEVAKGIYRQNGTIESAVRIPLILVHPWFFGVYPSYSPCQLTQDSEKKGYNLCIEKLLESYRQTGNNNIRSCTQNRKHYKESRRICRHSGEIYCSNIWRRVFRTIKASYCNLGLSCPIFRIF